MFNYKPLFALMIKDICLAPALKDFLTDAKDLSVYK